MAGGAAAVVDALDVLGHDAPVRPRAGEGGQVDPLLAREAPRERRGLHALALTPFGCWSGDGGNRRLLRLGGRRGRGCLGGRRLGRLRLDLFAGLPDESDRRPDRDLALRHDDLQEDARGLGLDLLRHLLRVQLVEQLTLLDGVARGLQPLDDRARLHPLPEPGKPDLASH